MKFQINGSGSQGDVEDAVNPSSSILHRESKQLRPITAAQRDFVNSTTRLTGRNAVRVVRPRPENPRELSDATGGCWNAFDRNKSENDLRMVSHSV